MKINKNLKLSKTIKSILWTSGNIVFSNIPEKGIEKD